MKGRSDRLASSDPPDDWVNGSWTVDCICGVNFDDGEEMVNCDECGVWVHTRCSRFVKGEKSFACDKCKSKAAKNDSEETEVAQLLVELPTKTIKLNNPYPLTNPPLPSRSPYKLWTNRPIDQRVHVQGIPGGDPAIFNGISSIFSSQLWKSSGYVPKKFNFSYKEFPCWDNKEQDQDPPVCDRTEGGSQIPHDNGAGVLYSLSKDTVLTASAPPTVSMRNQFKTDKKSSKDGKWEGGDSISKKSIVQNLVKEKKLPTLVFQCNKRSRTDLVPSKNRSAKKKTKVFHKEHSSKSDKAYASKTVEVCDSKAQKCFRADAEDDSHGPGNNAGSQEVTPNARLMEISSTEKPVNSDTADKRNLKSMLSEMSERGCSREKSVEPEKLDQNVSDQEFAKTEVILSVSPENDSVMRSSTTREVMVLDDASTYQESQTKPHSRDIRKSKLLVEGVANSALEVRDTEVQKNLETNMPLRSAYLNSKTKSDTAVDNHKGVLRNPFNDVVNTDGMKNLAEQMSSADHDSDNLHTATLACQSCQHGEREGDKGLAVSGCLFEKDDETTNNLCNTKLEYDSSESSLKIPKSLSHSKVTSRVAGETSKMTESIPSLPPSLSAGKSSISSSAIVSPKSFISDKNKKGYSHDPTSACKKIKSSSSLSMKKESACVDPIKDEDKHEKPKSTVKGVGELAASLHTQHALHVQDKDIATDGHQRGEKVTQQNLHSSSKSSHSLLAHLPASLNSPVGLSDEELALLLHQELNSSPRVPRVPRVRNAGSLPQLSSVSATSMLIKRTCSSGGKDQHMFTRRKNKDARKDGSRSCREQDNETRKVDNVPSSPDSAKTSDALIHGETSCDLLRLEKNIESSSTLAANTDPFSSNAAELKVSSNRDLLLNNPEDESCTDKGVTLTPRTLPGLIAEIMGLGKRMTYEELCDAVLPHWQNLRKHNGERYAYSSHSQAVLDCLRNRSEWARLVDRGPKTNASRKKRKIDAEPPYTESEDGEECTLKVGEGKSFKSNKEEFRKGKRKARTRRRTSLTGRGTKDDKRRRKKVDARSDDFGSSSDFSEESLSTEDKSQGSGMCASKSEVSASSDIGLD